MRIVSAFLLACQAAPQDVHGERTIASILSGGSVVDVNTIPDLLSQAGVQEDLRITSFLSSSRIKTLKFAQTQIVPTSTGSVSNADFCAYLHEAERHLPDLVVTCGKDINGEMTELDDSLHVNDPNTKFQTQLDRMRMGDVWGLIQQYPRKDVTVAVIDQGVDFTDPDMAPLKSTFNTSYGRVIDGGWNFIGDSSTLTVTPFYHGQRVSRVLAARGNNSAGMVGVAPDHVRLVSLQISGGLSELIEALEMAMDIGVDVISMSLRYHISHYSAERALLETVMLRAQERNILLVSAAGNDDEDAHDCYPCWYGGPNAMCVAALNNDPIYNLAGFSNFGDRVDIAAFGEDVYTGRGFSGLHEWSSGTSFATPMVSGAAAILLSLGVEPLMVKRILLADADRFQVAHKPLRPGGGALNILSSIKRAINSRFTFLRDVRLLPRGFSCSSIMCLVHGDIRDKSHDITYTAAPIPLKYIGLGNAVVFLCFGPLNVMHFVLSLTDSAQSSGKIPELLLFTLPVAMMVTVILSANNIRDMKCDWKAGCYTLEGMLGTKGSRMYRGYFGGLIIGAHLISVWVAIHYSCYGFLLTLAALPRSLWLINLVCFTPETDENFKFVDQASAHSLLIFGLSTALGISSVTQDAQVSIPGLLFSFVVLTFLYVVG
ncbi:hypothetical protein FOL47_000998 [Perkinsus chesapeaki]|uniref:subtilisin n=1 Tax=Perkinsus chesapeaki TaxID=330153 RepID=A0A7J6MKD7_PERCH|nr:hypothetical protein FOL47_000998 [Perkinsus chesapeaki]